MLQTDKERTIAAVAGLVVFAAPLVAGFGLIVAEALRDLTKGRMRELSPG